MSDCVLWTGVVNANGYGRRGPVLAHRFIYEQQVGPIQPGHLLHHRCGVRACVNVEHLVPMTRDEHNRLHLARTHCKRGHARTDARQCPVCAAARDRTDYWRKYRTEHREAINAYQRTWQRASRARRAAKGRTQ